MIVAYRVKIEGTNKRAYVCADCGRVYSEYEDVLECCVEMPDDDRYEVKKEEVDD